MDSNHRHRPYGGSNRIYHHPIRRVAWEQTLSVSFGNEVTESFTTSDNQACNIALCTMQAFFVNLFLREGALQGRLLRILA